MAADSTAAGCRPATWLPARSCVQVLGGVLCGAAAEPAQLSNRTAEDMLVTREAMNTWFSAAPAAMYLCVGRNASCLPYLVLYGHLKQRLLV